MITENRRIMRRILTLMVFSIAVCFGLFGNVLESHAAVGDEIPFYYSDYEAYMDGLDEATLTDIGVRVNEGQPFTVGPLTKRYMAKVFLFTPKKTGYYLIKTSENLDYKSGYIAFSILEKNEKNKYEYLGEGFEQHAGVSYNLVELTADKTYAILATNSKPTIEYQMVIESRTEKDSTEIAYGSYRRKLNEIDVIASNVGLDKPFTVGPISGTYLAKTFLFTPEQSGYYIIHTTGAIDSDKDSPGFSLYWKYSNYYYNGAEEIEGSEGRYIDTYLEEGKTYALLATNFKSANAYNLIIEKRPYQIGDKYLNVDDLDSISVMSEGVVSKVDNLDQDPGYRVYSFKPEKTGEYVIHTAGTVDLSANRPKFYLYASDGLVATKIDDSWRNYQLNGHYLYCSLDSDTTYFIIATNQKSKNSYGIIPELELEGSNYCYSLDSVKNVYKLKLSDTNLVDNIKRSYSGYYYSFCSFTANEDGYYHICKDGVEDEAFYSDYKTGIYVPSGDNKTHKKARGYKYVSLKAGETCYLEYHLEKNTKNFNVSVEKVSYITEMTVKDIGLYYKKTESFKNDKGVIVTAKYSDGSSKEININHPGLTIQNGVAIRLKSEDYSWDLEEGKESKWCISAGITGLRREYGDGDYIIDYATYDTEDDDRWNEEIIGQTAYLECSIKTIGSDEYISDLDYKNLELNKTYSISDGDMYLFTPSETIGCSCAFNYQSENEVDMYGLKCDVFDLDSSYGHNVFRLEEFSFTATEGHKYLISFEKDLEIPITFTFTQAQQQVHKKITNITVTNNPKFAKVMYWDKVHEAVDWDALYKDGFNEIKFEITYEDATVGTGSISYDESITSEESYYDRYGNEIHAYVTDDVYIDEGSDSSAGSYGFKFEWYNEILDEGYSHSDETFSFEIVPMEQKLIDFSGVDQIEVNKAYQITAGTSQFYRVTINSTGKHLLYTSVDIDDVALYDAKTGDEIEPDYDFYRSNPPRDCPYPTVYDLEGGKEYLVFVEAYDWDILDIDGIFILNYFNGETDPAIATDPNAIPADWQGVADIDGILEKIAAIPDEVTLKDKNTVSEASTAYSRLSEEGIAKLDDATQLSISVAKAKLDKAVSKIAELEEAAVALANNVINKANALPAVDRLALTDKDAVDEAAALYGQLTEDQISVLDETTSQALSAAKARIDEAAAKIVELQSGADEELKKQAKEAAQAVIDQINALPAEITLEDKEAVANAQSAYDALTAEQRALLDEATGQALAEAKAKLDAAQSKITELEDAEEAEEKAKEEAKEAAQAVANQIAALPDNVTLENKVAVEQAIEAYNSLTAEQLALLDPEIRQALEDAKAKLDTAQDKITELVKEEEAKEKAKEAKEAAQAVADQIAALPDSVTLENKEAVEKAIEAYNKLTPEQLASLDPETRKALEDAKAKLDIAKDKITELVKEEEAKEKEKEAEIPATKITVAKKKLYMKKGASCTLTYLLTPLNSTDKVTFTSSKKKVATVSATGKIKAKAKGTTKITITTSSGKKAVVTVNVAKKATKTKSVKASKKKMTLKVGNVKYIGYTRKPAKATDIVTFKSSKKSVVTVDSNGKLTARKKGKAKITIKAGKKKAVCTITVK